MADFWYRLVTPSKRHCFAKLTLYVHICHVCDGLYDPAPGATQLCMGTLVPTVLGYWDDMSCIIEISCRKSVKQMVCSPGRCIHTLYTMA